MKRLTNTRIGVEQGDVVMFSDFEDGGPMWTGKGPREQRREVLFSEAFRDPPSVHVALSLWDMEQSTNVRADVAAEYIRKDGFDLVFRTWGDTKVARIRMSWLAIGALPAEDDWDLY